MQSFHLEVEQLQQIFKCNNYPVGLIDRCVKTFLNRIYVPKRNFITVPKKDVIIVIFQSKNHLNNLFRFKDSIPKELRSHIVSKFLRSNCNITYYGETERHLNVRSGEHFSLLDLTGKRVDNNKKLAVKDHCLFFNHVGSFEDFSILKYESNPFKLLLKKHY